MHKRALLLGSAFVLLVGSVAAFANDTKNRNGPRYEFNCGKDTYRGGPDWFRPPWMRFAAAPPTHDEIHALGKMCAAREVTRSPDDKSACGQCCHGTALQSVIRTKDNNPNWIFDFWKIKEACQAECEKCIEVKTDKPYIRYTRPERNVLCLTAGCRNNIMGLYTCFPPPKLDKYCGTNPNSLGGMRRPSEDPVPPPPPPPPPRDPPAGGTKPPKKTGIFGPRIRVGKCCLPPSITAVAAAPPVCVEKTVKCEELGRLPPATGKGINCEIGDQGNTQCANIP